MASNSPVLARDGTAARPMLPSSVVTSTSTVGLPRESKICRAHTSTMTLMVVLIFPEVPAAEGTLLGGMQQQLTPVRAPGYRALAMRRIVIGLLGAGNVGGGVVRILQDHSDIEKRLGAQVVVKKILVRDLVRERAVGIPAGLLTTDPREVLDDPEIRMVVELIGGIEPALTYTMDALSRGKHVVTANKALMAKHGRELFAEAAHRKVAINFEASVGGGIPILRALREGLASDRIERITG